MQGRAANGREGIRRVRLKPDTTEEISLGYPNQGRTVQDRSVVDRLDDRLTVLLPPEYRDSYEDMQPTPMGSAGLKYDADGQVAWDEMWGSFCDLAMAGGPPHKGMLLGPGGEAEIDAQYGRYDKVVDEICRGITLVTGLRSYMSPTPGWVSVACLGDGMAGWLHRAIVMENVAARRRGAILELPAAPHFCLEREIKNVITVVAKTCHYWLGHMPPEHQQAIAELFVAMAAESPLIEPDLSRHDGELAERTAALIQQGTGLRRSNHRYAGWLGLECASVRAAVWMMRALITNNVLSRREGAVLFVPLNGATDPRGTIVARAVAHVYRCAIARGVC